jgi:predicted NACHT family NTPase
VESKRWLVILGDPGHAKTTLLRWITHTFAEIAHQRIEVDSLEGDKKKLFRIPILIRIGEFAEWFYQHPKLTLFDYIGQHTWFSQLYNMKENENALKQFIVHGYAQILLDGLDEIPDLERKGEIVTVVQEFLTKYTCTSHFLSPSENAFYNVEELLKTTQPFIEIQPENMAVGNQVIITSRIVGYQLHPLNGSFIVHSLLLPLTNQEADQFTKNWIEQVELSVADILLKNGVQLPSGINNACKIRRDNALKVVLHKDSKLSMLNPLLLSVICMSIFTSSKEFHPKCRIQIYNHAVQIAIRTWNNQKSNISESVLVDFLTDLASYLHIQSPSGLIDEFDMKHLCYLTFKRHNLSVNRAELRQFTNELISLLGSDVGIAANRGLQAFGFLHLSFQEYFVARALVQHSSEVEIVQRFLGVAIHFRFR